MFLRPALRLRGAARNVAALVGFNNSLQGGMLASSVPVNPRRALPAPAVSFHLPHRLLSTHLERQPHSEDFFLRQASHYHIAPGCIMQEVSD